MNKTEYYAACNIHNNSTVGLTLQAAGFSDLSEGCFLQYTKGLASGEFLTIVANDYENDQFNFGLVRMALFAADGDDMLEIIEGCTIAVALRIANNMK